MTSLAPHPSLWRVNDKIGASKPFQKVELNSQEKNNHSHPPPNVTSSSTPFFFKHCSFLWKVLAFFWSISLRKIHFDVASLSQKRITYPNLCLVKVDGQDFLQSTKLLASNVHSSRRFWSSQHLLSTIGGELTSRFTFFHFHFLSDLLSIFYLLLEVIWHLDSLSFTFIFFLILSASSIYYWSWSDI